MAAFATAFGVELIGKEVTESRFISTLIPEQKKENLMSGKGNLIERDGKEFLTAKSATIQEWHNEGSI